MPTGVYTPGTIYNLDYTNDSTVWDNKETCLLKSRTSESGNFVDYEVAGTQWFQIKKAMLPENSPLLMQDLMVELPGRSLNQEGGLQPNGTLVKSNDILQRADGTQWVVNIVELPSYVDRRVYVTKSTEPV